MCINTCARFVTSYLNSQGQRDHLPVNDEDDRLWAKRLEWVIEVFEEHLDRDHRAEDSLDKLQSEYEAVLRQSREAHERKYDHDLPMRLDAVNKSLSQFHLYGHMQLKCDEQFILS
jgi:hypothetical protein